MPKSCYWNRVPGISQWGSWRGKEVELRIGIEDIKIWRYLWVKGKGTGLWEGWAALEAMGSKKILGKEACNMDGGGTEINLFWKVHRRERKDKKCTIEGHRKGGFICCPIHGMTWLAFLLLLSEAPLVLQWCGGTITAKSTLSSTVPLARNSTKMSLFPFPILFPYSAGERVTEVFTGLDERTNSFSPSLKTCEVWLINDFFLVFFALVNTTSLFCHIAVP